MFYELYQALFSTISEDEAKQQVDICANPLDAQCVPSAPPTKTVQKIDLEGDIKRLEETLFNGYPLQEGFCIELSLKEILKICPRKRHRRDAYKSLQKKLSSMGVTLNITKK